MAENHNCILVFHTSGLSTPIHCLPIYGGPNIYFQTFLSVAGNAIVLNPVAASYHVHITIRDGSHIDSPIIYQGRLATGQLSEPMPAVVTQSEFITIKIHSACYRDNEYFNFELLTGPKGMFSFYYIMSKGTRRSCCSAQYFSHITCPALLSHTSSLFCYAFSQIIPILHYFLPHHLCFVLHSQR